MKRTAIIVDSGCDPSPVFIEKYKLNFMGMKIVIDEKEYTDGEDIKKDDFYKIITKAKEFHTAHPSVGYVAKKYEDIVAEKYDEIIDIHFSSKMSGLINTCLLAKNMVPSANIKIIDTESVSIESYLIAEKVVELIREKGWTYEQVMEVLPDIKASAFMQFNVTTLNYLVKNGRIGKAAGLAGTLLNIKPILGVNDGYIAPIDKVRGMSKVYSVIVDNAINFLKDRPYNSKVLITYGGENNIEHMKETYNLFLEKQKEINLPSHRLIESRISPTVICHSGPEVFGFAVYGEKEPIGL